MTKLEKNVEGLLKPIIEKLGYELYDVMYVKEAKDYYLRIFIDKNEGISIEDCEKVSNSISDKLDDLNIIKEQYFLEVSSPGLERLLRTEKHFKDNIGNEIEIKLFQNFNDKKIYKGILKNYNEDYITINIGENELKIERKNISIIKTVYNW